MKRVLILPIVAIALILSACSAGQPAPADAAADNREGQEVQMGVSGDMENMQMGSSAGEATPTPGSMASEPGGMGHMMEPIGGENAPLATETRGGQPLAFHEENGVKIFEITTRAVQWPILDGVSVTALTYNGTVPGPLIRITEGDRVRVVVNNELDDPTTVHFHGVELPNAMDGVPDVTQDPIQPGETFTYEFEAKPAGTFWYHSHFEGDVQVGAGLYAPFIVDPKEPAPTQPDVDVTLMIGEWLVRGGQTFAAMPMGGMEPNYFTINGKAFPATETINVKKGQLVRLRLVGTGQFIHPMHLHGLPFKIVATDGHPVPEAAQLTKDTLSVAPGERYDIEFVATEPGQWMLHCHILHHTTNDNVEPGGLMLVVSVTE